MPSYGWPNGKLVGSYLKWSWSNPCETQTDELTSSRLVLNTPHTFSMSNLTNLYLGMLSRPSNSSIIVIKLWSIFLFANSQFLANRRAYVKQTNCKSFRASPAALPMATVWLRTFTTRLELLWRWRTCRCSKRMRGNSPSAVVSSHWISERPAFSGPLFSIHNSTFQWCPNLLLHSSQVLLRSILQSFPARYCFQPQNPLKIDQTRRRRNILSDQKRPKTIHHLQKSKRIWITKQQLQLVSFLNITQLHMLTGL